MSIMTLMKWLANLQLDLYNNMVDFGEWLEENKQSLSEDVYGLFYDSYRCFKNDIDRPAYLLAYQGMMQHVRITMLQSSKRPDGFAELEWEDKWLKPLRDDDKWDGAEIGRAHV